MQFAFSFGIVLFALSVVNIIGLTLTRRLPVSHFRKFATLKMAQLIDGTAIAAQIRKELKMSVADISEQFGVTPGLAVVLVGARRDSATYVRMKKKACAEIGMASVGFDYPDNVTQDELIAKIDELNAGIYFSFESCVIFMIHSLTRCTDTTVNGILVQLPLPAHINERVVLDRIRQDKDVDGLHPLNVAQLANTKTHAPGRSAWSFDSIDYHVSCTPQVDSSLVDCHLPTACLLRPYVHS